MLIINLSSQKQFKALCELTLRISQCLFPRGTCLPRLFCPTYTFPLNILFTSAKENFPFSQQLHLNHSYFSKIGSVALQVYDDSPLYVMFTREFHCGFFSSSSGGYFISNGFPDLVLRLFIPQTLLFFLEKMFLIRKSVFMRHRGPWVLPRTSDPEFLGSNSAGD